MYIFNKRKLTEILKDFHTITKATISIWDVDFNQLIFYPNPMTSLCSKIKSNPLGKKMCLQSDIEAFKKATINKSPYTFTCHAGLIDTVVPVYSVNEVIAYIIFGQVRDTEQVMSNVDNVKKLCKKYGINEKCVEEYYNELPMMDMRQIEAASNFLKMCTNYLHISQMIKIEKNELASGIDNYITENIKQELSVDELCNKFRISKNVLYQISHKFFNTTIKDYVTRKRLDLAKNLLTNTQLSVSEISLKCGFTDYNYFIRVFKSKIGHTPLAYRKKFPLELL